MPLKVWRMLQKPFCGNQMNLATMELTPLQSGIKMTQYPPLTDRILTRIKILFRIYIMFLHLDECFSPRWVKSLNDHYSFQFLTGAHSHCAKSKSDISSKLARCNSLIRPPPPIFQVAHRNGASVYICTCGILGYCASKNVPHHSHMNAPFDVTYKSFVPEIVFGLA